MERSDLKMDLDSSRDSGYDHVNARLPLSQGLDCKIDRVATVNKRVMTLHCDSAARRTIHRR